MTADTTPEPIRRRILFYGRVQGVGFRYTTVSIARRYPVVGYVRNLPNGSVELVAEAKPSVLDQFVADIAAQFAGHIQQQETHDVVRDEVFDTFGTRR